MSFIDHAEQYLKTGYKGQVPEEGCSVHLANLINPQWLQALEKKGIRKKDLKGVLDLLKEEGQLMHPKHQSSRYTQFVSYALNDELCSKKTDYVRATLLMHSFGHVVNA